VHVATDDQRFQWARTDDRPTVGEHAADELRGSASDLRHVHADFALGRLDSLRSSPVARASRLGRALVPGTNQEGGHFVFHGALQHQPRSQSTQLGQLLAVRGQLVAKQFLDLRLQPGARG
jgi:hypothetical protein